MCYRLFGTQAHRQLAKAVFDHSRWRQRDPVGPKATEALHQQRLCARSEGARERMRKLWDDAKESFFDFRHLMVLRVYVWTPFGDSAVPSYITACESGDNYRSENPNSSAGGRYQILDTTWYAYGGSYYPSSHPAAMAPPWEQDKIAHKIWEASGPSAWSCG